jgi:hypothetical protein
MKYIFDLIINIIVITAFLLHTAWWFLVLITTMPVAVIIVILGYILYGIAIILIKAGYLIDRFIGLLNKLYTVYHKEWQDLPLRIKK